MTAPTLEVCVDDAAGIAACVAGGADRIELCSALSLGGLTPSAGLMEVARGCGIPTMVMIRPRAGDFAYSRDEVVVMRNDIAAAKAQGLAGVVLGMTDAAGALAEDVLRDLVALAAPMQVTLHRVIDTMLDPVGTVGKARAIGFTRILSSGGARKASDGIDVLAQMAAAANGRIELMAGSGVTAQNVVELARATGITAFHASCARSDPSDVALHELGFVSATQRMTDAREIKVLRRQLSLI